MQEQLQWDAIELEQSNTHYLQQMQEQFSANDFYGYGVWMPENNNNQVEMLNAKLSNNAQSIPHRLKTI